MPKTVPPTEKQQPPKGKQQPAAAQRRRPAGAGPPQSRPMPAKRPKLAGPSDDQRFVEAYRRDLINDPSHHLQELEGHAIARRLGVNARVMKEAPDGGGAIQDQGIGYGDPNGKPGILLHVNGDHYIVIAPSDDASARYVDERQHRYQQIYATLTNGNCLIDGLYFIANGRRVPPFEAMQLRIAASNDVQDEQIAALRPVLAAEMAANGTLTGVGAHTKRFFNSLSAPAAPRVRLPSESDSDPEIDALWQPGADLESAEKYAFKESDTSLLTQLNEAIAAAKTEADIKAILRSKRYDRFVVAQYRGITYMKNRFNAEARRRHRKMPRIGHPVYPDALRPSQLSREAFYMGDLRGNSEIEAQAEILRRWFADKRKASPILDKGRVIKTGGKTAHRIFPTASHFIQSDYSQDYSRSRDLIGAFYKKNDAKLRQLKASAASRKAYSDTPAPSHPFVSTSDTPEHAIRYALGNKPIEEEQKQRLRPNWLPSGKPAHPYTGVVYVSFHPVRDYLSPYAPSHVFSGRKQGTLSIDNRISQERESSFLTIKAKRVVLAYPVRWPALGDEKNPAASLGLKQETRQQYGDLLAHPEQHADVPDIQSHLESKLGKRTESFLAERIERGVKAAALRRHQRVIYRGLDGQFVLSPPSYEVPSEETRASWAAPSTQQALDTLFDKIRAGEQPYGHAIEGYFPNWPSSRFYRRLSEDDSEPNG